MVQEEATIEVEEEKPPEDWCQRRVFPSFRVPCTLYNWLTPLAYRAVSTAQAEDRHLLREERHAALDRASP